MKLTYAQKKHFYDHGYVRVPGVVPRIMVDAAVKAINNSLGEGMDPAQMPIYRAQTYCPELRGAPVITDLLNRTPAWSIAESVLGEGRIQPVTGAQIALRFPTMKDPPGEPGPHLDGMYSPTNGVPEGTIQNFTALMGVVLSELTTSHAGNLAVWPGSHRLYEKYFREHGPEALLKGLPPVDIGQPVHMLGQPGDIILCHYQLAHGITPNASPNVRYALYFRLYSTDYSRDNWQAPMRDIWMHWPGMRDVLPKEG